MMFFDNKQINNLKEEIKFKDQEIQRANNETIKSHIEFVKLVLALKELYDDDFINKIIKRAYQIDPEPYLKPYQKNNCQINLRFYL